MRQSFVDSSLESSLHLLFTINLFLIKMSNTSGDSLLSDSFLLRNFCRHLKTLETKKFPQNLFSRLGRLSVRLSFDTKYERPTLISHITKEFAKKRGQRKDIGIVLLWKYILYADLLSLLVLTVPFCATLPATTDKTWYWLLFEKINNSLRLIVNKLFCLFRKTMFALSASNYAATLCKHTIFYVIVLHSQSINYRVSSILTTFYLSPSSPPPPPRLPQLLTSQPPKHQ